MPETACRGRSGDPYENQCRSRPAGESAARGVGRSEATRGTGKREWRPQRDFGLVGSRRIRLRSRNRCAIIEAQIHRFVVSALGETFFPCPFLLRFQQRQPVPGKS